MRVPKGGFKWTGILYNSKQCYFDPPAGKLVFSAAKAAENTLFSCRRTVNK
jgi:hypothetical protein